MVKKFCIYIYDDYYRKKKAEGVLEELSPFFRSLFFGFRKRKQQFYIFIQRCNLISLHYGKLLLDLSQ